MLLGIDVGGTHTDAVVICEDGICAAFKTPTNHENLLESIDAVLTKVVGELGSDLIERVTLSTTLTTNAIVESTVEDVGMLVVGGPGIDPEHAKPCEHFRVLRGACDHRGQIVAPIDPNEARSVIDGFLDKDIRAFAVVTKFSPRNPETEQNISELIGERADQISLGHEMTGRLNFPRRIATAYYNSACWRLFNEFADAVEQSLARFEIDAHLFILKADGGTMPLAQARRFPVQSILSGPAASVMGIISMCNIALDSVILDIGGTTTDIAVFAGGEPLMERDGIAIDGRPTLVRSLRTRSIGVGGDSELAIVDGEVRVGPHRRGPAMAFGGSTPTLMDAFNVLGESEPAGDATASRRGVAELADTNSMRPETLARAAVDAAVTHIQRAVGAFVDEINERPVYTIHELLEDRRIVPQKIYVMGGPATAFRMPLFRAFSLSVSAPKHYDVANAVGAALTRPTDAIELFADTEQLRMHIPSLAISRAIESDYDLDDGVRDAKRALLNAFRLEAIPAREEHVQVVEASSFNMVEGVRRVGRNIRVKCQITPGIQHRYKELLGQLC
jgi:N-methylhydantoinase A/oxoprolinase/acetone carboxylase beta subunit